MSILSWLKRRRLDDQDFEEEIRAHLAIAADERMDDSMDVYERAGDNLYHDAIYHEGTCMLFDLENTIGRSAMDQVLRALLTKYEYGVETPADVRAVAQSVSGRDLSAFWAKWRNTGD